MHGSWRLGLAAILACLVSMPAAANPKRDHGGDDLERLEVAREHFQLGEQLADQGKLEEALIELELAEVAHPSGSVVEAKERVRAQLAARRRRQQAPAAVVVAPPASPSAARSSRRPLARFAAPIALAPLALGGLVAGAALLGTVASDADRLQASCAPSCAPKDVDPLRLRRNVGYGLLGVGAGLAVIDIALWAWLGSRHERALARLAPMLEAGPGFASVGLGGGF